MTDVDYAQRIVDSASHDARTDNYRDAVTRPPTTEVELPGGLFNPIDGVVIKDAVVREINGWDEEILAQMAAKDPGAQLVALLERATVSIGDEKANPEVLDMLYAGDWDALLLGIRIASFGAEVEWEFPCRGCDGQRRVVSVDLESDVHPRTLEPEDEPGFTYEGRRSTYEVTYPKGSSTRRLFKLKQINPATLTTETLFGSILSIDGKEVSDIRDIRSMPAADREAIFIKVQKQMPSLRLEEVTKTCDDCGSEVRVPLSLAALFRGRAASL